MSGFSMGLDCNKPSPMIIETEAPMRFDSQTHGISHIFSRCQLQVGISSSCKHFTSFAKLTRRLRHNRHPFPGKSDNIMERRPKAIIRRKGTATTKPHSPLPPRMLYRGVKKWMKGLASDKTVSFPLQCTSRYLTPRRPHLVSIRPKTCHHCPPSR